MSWSAPKASDHDGPVDSYEVVLSSPAGTRVERVVGTTVTIDALTPDTKYDVEVTAWNASGAGKSATKEVRTDKPIILLPGEVKDLQATPTSSSVSLTWTAPKTSDKEGSVTSYTVVISSAGVPLVTTTTAGTAITVPGLLASTSYDATVAAVNGAGAGKATSKSFKTAKAATVPKGRPAAKGTIPATPATRSSAVSQDDEHTPRHSVRTYIPACYRLAPEPG